MLIMVSVSWCTKMVEQNRKQIPVYFFLKEWSYSFWTLRTFVNKHFKFSSLYTCSVSIYEHASYIIHREALCSLTSCPLVFLWLLLHYEIGDTYRNEWSIFLSILLKLILAMKLGQWYKIECVPVFCKIFSKQ